MFGTNSSVVHLPQVSIIMTTYNAEEHIEESLRSALAQDIGALEVLCVDGHSTDHTIQIIQKISKKDSRVRLLYQERPGIGAAKNCGIEYAQGEFITFLDADDFYVDSSALSKMYEACKIEGVRVCGAFRSTLFLDGTVENEPLHRNDCKPGMSSARLKYRDRPYDYHFHSYLYDREMIVGSDARFAEVKAYDDTHFFIRAMLAAEEFCVVPVELYRYRCGPPYSWGMERANDAIYALTDQLRLTKEHGLAVLHWLTLQRINYEYGPIFEKNVLDGDFELLKRLTEANEAVDPALIGAAEASLPSEKWYLEPMMHRKYADMPLRRMDVPYAPPYLLEPLWRVLYPNGRSPMEDRTQTELAFLRARIDELENTLSQKAAETPWLLRKLKGGVRCFQEHGFLYTVYRAVYKLQNFFRRK